MPSPIAHTLAGLGLAAAIPSRGAPALLWAALGIFAANAPDLDFVPGLILGDANRWHQGPSHSLAAALALALAGGGAAYLAGRGGRARAALVAALLAAGLASHLLLDLFAEDRREPMGIPLLWPWSTETFKAPWVIFGAIRHGGPETTLRELVAAVLSRENLAPVLREVAVLLPLLLAAAVLRRARRRGAPSPP
ncbi:MAG TPA: metal-dependent hydrolase [Planctomycetota bacterium]|nr:metal-dependent hydrolase [Planctomycetota bacterium]